MKATEILDENYYRRRPDAYDRDYQSSIAGMGGGRRREVDDEANIMYRFDDASGKLKQRMIDVRDEWEAKSMGWRYEWKDALRVANIIQSKFDPKKFVQKQGGKWVPVNPFKDKVEEPKQDEGLDMNLLKAAQKHSKENPPKKDPESERNAHKPYGYRSDSGAKEKGLDDLTHPADRKKKVKENATAGATNAANIGTVVNPHHSPGKARGKKSYLGSPGSGSGKKAPAQPKVIQPKKKDGTAVNGIDIKGSSLFGGPANEAAVIKRR